MVETNYDKSSNNGRSRASDDDLVAGSLGRRPTTDSDRWAAEEKKAIAVERERGRAAIECEKVRTQGDALNQAARETAFEETATRRQKRDLEFAQKLAPLIENGLAQMAKITSDDAAARAATIIKLAEIDLELAREFMAEGRAAQDGALAILAKVAEAVIYKLKTE